jgi:membrane protein EpsK
LVFESVESLIKTILTIRIPLENSSRTRNFLAGLLSGYTATFVSVVIGLWLTPFILRYLNRAEYAIFALCMDVLAWLTMVDLGISPALKVKVAQQTGTPDHEQLNRVASTTFFTQLGLVGVLAIAGAALVYLFPIFFRVQPELQSEARLVLGFLVMASAIGLGTQTFSAILVAYQQIHVDNLIRLALIAIRALLIVTLLLCGFKLLSLAIASLVAVVITTALSIVRCFRAVPGLSLRFNLFSWSTLRSIGNLGIWFTLGGLALFLISGLDKTVAARMVSLEAVTTLYLTGRVYALSLNMLNQLTSTARPALGQLIGQGKLLEARLNSQHLLSLSAGGAAVAALSLFAGNGSFLPWWVSKVNYGGWLLDLGLALNLIVHNWVTPMHIILSAGLTVRPQTICYFIEGLLNLILSIILTLHFGLIGVVYSTLIARLLTSSLYLPWLTAKMFQQRYLSFLSDNIHRSLPIIIILTPIAFWARTLGPNFKGVLSFMIPMAITAATGCILLWTITFDNMLRHKVYKVLSNVSKFPVNKP